MPLPLKSSFLFCPIPPPGLPPAFFSSLFSGTTHYGTGPAPMYFGSGYVTLATWWRLGFLINIIVWLVVGGLWWKALGYW